MCESSVLNFQVNGEGVLSAPCGPALSLNDLIHYRMDDVRQQSDVSEVADEEARISANLTDSYDGNHLPSLSRYMVPIAAQDPDGEFSIRSKPRVSSKDAELIRRPMQRNS